MTKKTTRGTKYSFGKPKAPRRPAASGSSTPKMPTRAPSEVPNPLQPSGITLAEEAGSYEFEFTAGSKLVRQPAW